MADHYRALGIESSATAHEILAAYRAKAARQHPDVGGNPFDWAEIQRAYDTLIDEGSRTAYDAENEDWNDDDDNEGSVDSVDEPWYRPLESFDLLSTLGVRRCDGDSGIVGGGTRCRACFYKLAQRTRPLAADRYTSRDDYAAEVVTFRQVCLAFVALRDDAKCAIYLRGGFEHLRASEEYQEPSIFSLDAQHIYDDFFNGVDEDDRNFLLFNGEDAADDGFDGERLPRRDRQLVSRESGCGPSPSAAPGSDAAVELVVGDSEGWADDDEEDEDEEADWLALRAVQQESACLRGAGALHPRLRDLPPPPPPPEAGLSVPWESEDVAERHKPWPQVPAVTAVAAPADDLRDRSIQDIAAALLRGEVVTVAPLTDARASQRLRRAKMRPRRATGIWWRWHPFRGYPRTGLFRLSGRPRLSA